MFEFKSEPHLLYLLPVRFSTNVNPDEKLEPAYSNDNYRRALSTPSSQGVTFWCRYWSQDRSRDHFGLENGLEIWSRHSR